VDATAQGSQICNGWRQNEAGARKCNLLPTEAPGDVYKAIWEAIVDEACHRGSIRPKILKAWKEKGYGRMIAKKCIFMGGQYGCRLGQMRRDFHKIHWEDVPEEYWMNKVEWHLLFDKPEEGLSVVEVAINKVCSISAIVRWFRERAAEVHASNKRYLKIPTPNGNVVLMKYGEEVTTRVRTFHHGSMAVDAHKVNIKSHTRTPDLNDWEKAVLANVVHAADASLLSLALHDFPLNVSTVHDSIASAPGKSMDILVRRLKQSMYDTITWNIWDEFLTVNGLEPDPAKAPPIIGTLDPSKILKSDYMFC
jgi:DNA-directed RNA polymerase